MHNTFFPTCTLMSCQPFNFFHSFSEKSICKESQSKPGHPTSSNSISLGLAHGLSLYSYDYWHIGSDIFHIYVHCLEAYSSDLNVISAEVRPGSLRAGTSMNWSLLTAHFNNSSLIATECRSKMDWERSHAAKLRRWSPLGTVNSYTLDRHVSYLERSGCCVCIHLLRMARSTLWD